MNARRLEQAATLVGELGSMVARSPLLALFTSRLQSDFGYERVAFYPNGEGGVPRGEAEARAGVAGSPVDAELIAWSLRGTRPLPSAPGVSPATLAVPVRAGDAALGVLEVVCAPGSTFSDDDANLLSTLAGQLAAALQRAASVAETERLAAQMATLYDVGLETGALRDLRLLFVKATEEAGRLIKADHASVLRFDDDAGYLRMFAAWARDPIRENYGSPVFRLGEGVAGLVARDRIPALVNDVPSHRGFVERSNPVSRLLCVPLVYFDQERQDTVLFGVLNATRLPGAPRFTHDDLEYLTRFAGQLSVGVANSMAFAAERERSEQLALVNTLLREISGSLSRERILETAVLRIHEAFRYPVVAISQPDFERGTYKIVSVASPVPIDEEWGSFPIEAGVTGRVYRERRTMLVPDVSQDPDYLGLVASTRSECAVPIFSGDEVAAVLNVESDARRGFDRAHVITLETLADGVGILLRNAELFAALERTNAQLVELDRTKSELVNVVAHDFRAPLAGMLGHAELLEWRPDAPVAERVEQARAIMDAAAHMATLVDKTLKTTRLEAGHFPFEFALVDLAAVAAKVIERIPQDGRHPLTLVLPEEPLPVWADRDRLSEVLENLISNAVQVLARGRRRGGRAGPRGRPGHGGRARPRHRHRRRRPGPPLPAVLARARPPRGRRSRDPASASTSATAWCARTAAASRSRASSTAARSSRSRCRCTAVPPPACWCWWRPATSGRAARCGAWPRSRASPPTRSCDGVEAVEAALRLVPAAVVLDRVLPKLRRRRWPSGCATTARPRRWACSRWPTRTSWATRARCSPPASAAGRPGPAGGGPRRGRARPGVLTAPPRRSDPRA